MKGSAMRLSTFWHYIKDVDMLWNSLFFSWCKIPSSVREIFKRREYFHEKNLLPAVRAMLTENGFLIHEDQEKELIEKLVSRKMTSEIKSLYLIMSTSCNLACDYCLYGPSQSGSLKVKGRNLSEKEIRDAINIFRQKTLGNKRTEPDYWEQVTFYGGEPLLNPRGIKTGVEMIRKIQREQQIWQNIKIIIDTNGTLIDDDFIDFSKRNNISVQISIDGPEEIHNRTRKFRNGNGSFRLVHEAMLKIRKMKLDFLPLVTVSPANLDSLSQCVEVLCREFMVKEIAMNLLMFTGDKSNRDYGRSAAIAMSKAFIIAEQFGATDSVFDEVLQRFAHPTVAPEICGAGVKIAAFPGGGLHACQALENCRAGYLGKTLEFSESNPNWQTWKKRTRFSNQACLECPVIGFCGGGCAASAFVATGDLNHIDPYYCDWMKQLFLMWIKGNLPLPK